MVLNILVSLRQWLQIIYPSLVGTEVEVKYSIFLYKVYKGLYPHTQAKKKKISLPHRILVWKPAHVCITERGPVVTFVYMFLQGSLCEAFEKSFKEFRSFADAVE